MRGTFANIRLRNQLAPGTEGGVTRHLPDGEEMSIYDAAMSTPTKACRWSCSAARSTARARRATGRPRARTCSASARSSPRASSASTARTSSAWACCRCSSPTARPPSRSGLTGEEEFEITGRRRAAECGRVAAARRDRRRRRQGVPGARADRHAQGGATTSATAGSCRSCCASSTADGPRPWRVPPRRAPARPGRPQRIASNRTCRSVEAVVDAPRAPPAAGRRRVERPPVRRSAAMTSTRGPGLGSAEQLRAQTSRTVVRPAARRAGRRRARARPPDEGLSAVLRAHRCSRSARSPAHAPQDGLGHAPPATGWSRRRGRGSCAGFPDRGHAGGRSTALPPGRRP